MQGLSSTDRVAPMRVTKLPSRQPSLVPGAKAKQLAHRNGFQMAECREELRRTRRSRPVTTTSPSRRQGGACVPRDIIARTRVPRPVSVVPSASSLGVMYRSRSMQRTPSQSSKRILAVSGSSATRTSWGTRHGVHGAGTHLPGKLSLKTPEVHAGSSRHRGTDTSGSVAVGQETIP